jgi:hypothetical protein
LGKSVEDMNLVFDEGGMAVMKMRIGDHPVKE